MSYAYDEMRRVIGVTGRNEVNGAETPVTKSYTYENDRLKTIGHHGMNYTFDYDGFGNVVQTKVGNQVISTTTYKPNSSLAEKSCFSKTVRVSAPFMTSMTGLYKRMNYGAVAWNIRTIGIRMIMKAICPMLKIS